MFRSFFLGGFECSSHCRRDGRRLDLLHSTGHAANAEQDYRQLQQHGIYTVRDGVRWHLIEENPGKYEWASFVPMLEAAERAGTEVIWDLCHYGWPDHLDIWDAEFVRSFGRFAAAVALLVQKHSSSRNYCLINEISYWAWAGGEVGHMNPCALGRGRDLKAQLVRASKAAMDEIRRSDPQARFLHAEPLIHVRGDPERPSDTKAAEAYRQSQWEAWDMLSGRLRPQLGGNSRYLDVLGVNFYPHNQWYYEGRTIPFGYHHYRPLREMLYETFSRYRQPLLIAETGAEGSTRAAWLHYVTAEALAAMQQGVQITGICLYPVVDYRGWDNDRPCAVGLLGETRRRGQRSVYQPLAQELLRQQSIVGLAGSGERHCPSGLWQVTAP
jgi:beta-glucosidase/6-phospho-beta-glucosidase/beta-galactosidase